MQRERVTEAEKTVIAASLMRDAATLLYQASDLEIASCAQAAQLRLNARRKVLTAVDWMRSVESA